MEPGIVNDTTMILFHANYVPQEHLAGNEHNLIIAHRSSGRFCTKAFVHLPTGLPFFVAFEISNEDPSGMRSRIYFVFWIYYWPYLPGCIIRYER